MGMAERQKRFRIIIHIGLPARQIFIENCPSTHRKEANQTHLLFLFVNYRGITARQELFAQFTAQGSFVFPVAQ
jgi:hypothetical protein